MITEKIIYEAECCNCGEAYIDDGSIVFYNREKLLQDLINDDWQIIYAGVDASDAKIVNIYCPQCHPEI